MIVVDSQMNYGLWIINWIIVYKDNQMNYGL